MLDYRIITKEEYKKIRLNSVSNELIGKGTIKHIEDEWNRLRKGYEFAIAAGREDKPMFYGVDYFNKNVLQGKSKSNELTVKLNLDTTEFEDKLNRIENKIEELNDIEYIINNMDLIRKTFLEGAKQFKNKIKEIKQVR